MNALKKNKTKETVAMAAILIISFVVWLVVPYAHHVASGSDISWNYYIVKGIIVSAASVAVYLLAGKYATAVFDKYGKPILFAGTAVVLIFTILDYRLSRIDNSALSEVLDYAYAALPFL